MNKVEGINESLETLKNNMEEKQAVLADKESEKSRCQSRLKTLDNKQNERDYVVPSKIRSQLIHVVKYTAFFLVSFILFYSFAFDFFTSSSYFTHFFPFLLNGVLPATGFGSVYFYKESRHNRRRLKRLNSIDFYAERSAINSEIRELEREIIQIKSQIIALDERRKSIIRQSNNFSNVVVSAPTPNYDNQYESYNNFERRR